MEQGREREAGAPNMPEGSSSADAGQELSLYEERLRINKDVRERIARLRKEVTEEPFAREVPRAVEDVDVERVPAGPEDSGEVEVLPDGSLSVPLLEEEVVVTKRTVVRERVILRRHVHTEHRRIETTVRREHAILEDPDAAPPQDHRAAS